MSRIRQIKPAFFRDPDMAALSADVRLFYIGLWTLADDAGYYRWDVAEVGLELYGFDPRAEREAFAIVNRDALTTAGRIVLYPCEHLFIPTFTEHQRFAGPTKRVLTYEREHLVCVRPADPRTSPQLPADPRLGIGIGIGTVGVGERNVSESHGSAAPLAPDGASPREGETESDFRKRAGLPVFMSEARA